jgi:DHA1 family tetracycline resistance protein-like MFS transporter
MTLSEAEQFNTPAAQAKRQGHSPLMIIFTTVFMDLVGFGMIIPLQAIFGKALGASGWMLGFLGAAYPLAQFFFSPFWGQLSDRYGRRPILIMSMTGSTLAYLGFSYAIFTQSLGLLILTRFLQGLFAANISAAQAYIADVTAPEKRAGGMALIGAAFGIGFILGPALGGESLAHWGVLAPGFVASAICGINLLVALVRLPESLSLQIQHQNRALPFRRYDPLNLGSLKKAAAHPYLGLLLLMTFLQVTAFGAMEQVFALFFKEHLNFTLVEAGKSTGRVLAFVGAISAVIQGGFIRKLVPRFGERRLLSLGLFLFGTAIFLMPFGPTYNSYFLIMIPLAIGRSFIDPNTSALVSKASHASEQGRAMGTFQGLSSLARVIGPLVGLTLFQTQPALPFILAGCLCTVVFFLSLLLWRRTQGLPGVDSAAA